MLVAFAIWPSGGAGNDSVRDAVATAVRIIHASGLPNPTDSMFTTIQGGWDEIFEVIHRTVDAMAAYGKRSNLLITADIRLGHDNELTGRVERLEKAIANQN